MEEQSQLVERQTELNELLQFKEQPYYKRLDAWMQVQRDELHHAVELSSDPHALLKASGGLRVLSVLTSLLNQEQMIREQLTALLNEETDE